MKPRPPRPVPTRDFEDLVDQRIYQRNRMQNYEILARHYAQLRHKYDAPRVKVAEARFAYDGYKFSKGRLADIRAKLNVIETHTPPLKRYDHLKREYTILFHNEHGTTVLDFREFGAKIDNLRDMCKHHLSREPDDRKYRNLINKLDTLQEKAFRNAMKKYKLDKEELGELTPEAEKPHLELDTRDEKTYRPR